MSADQLADQIDAGDFADAQQDDGQIARDAVPPQSRLAATVFGQNCGRRRQLGCG